MKLQSCSWRVAWKCGAGCRWAIAVVGPDGEEVVVRASTAVRAEDFAHAVCSAEISLNALRKAHTALYPQADPASSEALEAAETALAAMDDPLLTSRETIPGHAHLYHPTR
jgi:hypothetical protein